MKLHELEHIIRAASVIANDDELIIIGSQAILGQFPDPPAELCVSTEADLWPKNHPERWELIDGSIGELSPFHDTFGYYGQGVEEGTAILPPGWRERLIGLRSPATRGATGWCLELHDLLLYKHVAGRDQDRRFTRVAAQHGLSQPELLLERLAQLTLTSEHREAIRGRILADHLREG